MVEDLGHRDVGLVRVLTVQVVTANLHCQPVGSLATDDRTKLDNMIPDYIDPYPSQQWPAVMTLSAWIREPPHMREPPTPPLRRAIW